MRARRICLLTALTFAAVCCTPAGGPAPVAPPPPAGWSGPGPVPPPRRMRLFFGGDVMQHMPQVDAVRRGDGFDYEPVFRTLAPRIRAADLAVVNLETTLTRRSRYTGYPLFRSPAALADALRDAGVDVAVPEASADVYELLDTGLGKCRMCVAAPADYKDDPSRPVRVATKFVNIAKSYYASMGRDIDIIKLNGSIELAPILGLSDVIVDIVETGTTLRENGLKVVTEFMPISARFIANKASYQFKHAEMDTMLEKLRAELQNKEEAK